MRVASDAGAATCQESRQRSHSDFAELLNQSQSDFEKLIRGNEPLIDDDQQLADLLSRPYCPHVRSAPVFRIVRNQAFASLPDSDEQYICYVGCTFARCPVSLDNKFYVRCAFYYDTDLVKTDPRSSHGFEHCIAHGGAFAELLAYHALLADRLDHH